MQIETKRLEENGECLKVPIDKIEPKKLVPINEEEDEDKNESLETGEQ